MSVKSRGQRRPQGCDLPGFIRNSGFVCVFLRISGYSQITFKLLFIYFKFFYEDLQGPDFVHQHLLQEINHNTVMCYFCWCTKIRPSGSYQESWLDAWYHADSCVNSHWVPCSYVVISHIFLLCFLFLLCFWHLQTFVSSSTPCIRNQEIQSPIMSPNKTWHKTFRGIPINLAGSMISCRFMRQLMLCSMFLCCNCI